MSHTTADNLGDGNHPEREKLYIYCPGRRMQACVSTHTYLSILVQLIKFIYSNVIIFS